MMERLRGERVRTRTASDTMPRLTVEAMFCDNCHRSGNRGRVVGGPS
jgi:hypothetical protein